MMSGWLWLLIAVVVIVVVVGVVLWMRSGSATDTGADDPADPGTRGPGTDGPGTGGPGGPGGPGGIDGIDGIDGAADAGRPVPAPPPDAERPGSLFETTPAEPTATSTDDAPEGSEPDETPATAGDDATPLAGTPVVTDSHDLEPPVDPGVQDGAVASETASEAAPTGETGSTGPGTTGSVDEPPTLVGDPLSRSGGAADRNVTPDARADADDDAPDVEAGLGDAATETGGSAAEPDEPGSPAEAEPERTVAGPGTTWTDVEPAPAGSTSAGPASTTGSAPGDPAPTGSALGDSSPTGSAPGGFAEAAAAETAAPPPLPASGSALASLDAVLIVPATGEPVPGPHPGSVQAPADGSAPPDSHRIKAHSGSRRYHTLDSPYYIRTRADIYFVGVEEAEAAGFVAWNSRPGGAPRRP